MRAKGGAVQRAICTTCELQRPSETVLHVMDYKSVVIFDLEFTAWPGSLERKWTAPGEYREIVQIGAVRLDRDYCATHTIDLIVRPKFNPILSEYFISLTGIRQQRVDREGLTFPDAMDRFTEFLTQHATVAYSNGRDEAILLENLAFHDLPPQLPNIAFFDIQPWFQAALDEESEFIPSHQFLTAAKLPNQAAAHDAVNDARTIASAIRHLRLEGAPPLPHELR